MSGVAETRLGELAARLRSQFFCMCRTDHLHSLPY